MPGRSRRTSGSQDAETESGPLDKISGFFGRLFGSNEERAQEQQSADVIQDSPTPLLDQMMGPDPASLKSFPGYQADWHQSQDALIQKVVDEFNAEKGWDSSHPHYLDANLVKAWALQESGGHKDVFSSGDMMQVNVPGDWVPEKQWFGLGKREKMDPEKSLRTALDWAYYKGEASAPMKGDEPSTGWHPTQRGSKSFDGYQSKFQGWKKALSGYNGGGVSNYFGKIDRRAQSGR